LSRYVTAALWDAVAPHLPPHAPSPKGGRPPVPDRICLEGIVFVLRSGARWRDVPKGMGSGSTCWRRFAAWTDAGVWGKAHHQLLKVLGRKGLINLERAVLDSASVRALKGGRTPAPAPPTAASGAANGMC